MHRVLLLTTLLLTTAAVAAADWGRYQAVVIPEAGRSGPNASFSSWVFILDTQEGHLWTWGDNEPIYDSSGRPKFGSVLTYQGRLRPGKQVGEVIEKGFAQ